MEDAYEIMVTIPKTVENVGDIPSSIHTQNKLEKRKVSSKDIGLGRQRIGFHGHYDSDTFLITRFCICILSFLKPYPFC